MTSSLTRDEISQIVGGNQRAIEFFERLNDIVAREDPPWSRRDFIGDIVFDRVPIWAKEIRFTFSGVSLAAPDDILIQIGYLDPVTLVEGWYTDGYFTGSTLIDGAVAATSENVNGFYIQMGSATQNVSGILQIFRMPTKEPQFARWCCGYTLRGGLDRVIVGGGRRIVDQIVDRVRLVTATGVLLDDGLIGMEAFR